MSPRRIMNSGVQTFEIPGGQSSTLTVPCMGGSYSAGNVWIGRLARRNKHAAGSNFEAICREGPQNSKHQYH